MIKKNNSIKDNNSFKSYMITFISLSVIAFSTLIIIYKHDLSNRKTVINKSDIEINESTICNYDENPGIQLVGISRDNLSSVMQNFLDGNGTASLTDTWCELNNIRPQNMCEWNIYEICGKYEATSGLLSEVKMQTGDNTKASSFYELVITQEKEDSSYVWLLLQDCGRIRICFQTECNDSSWISGSIENSLITKTSKLGGDRMVSNHFYILSSGEIYKIFTEYFILGRDVEIDGGLYGIFYTQYVLNNGKYANVNVCRYDDDHNVSEWMDEEKYIEYARDYWKCDGDYLLLNSNGDGQLQPCTRINNEEFGKLLEAKLLGDGFQNTDIDRILTDFMYDRRY